MLLVFSAVPGFTSEQTKRRKSFHSESIIRLWRTCEFPKNKCRWSVKGGRWRQTNRKGRGTRARARVCMCVCVCVCVCVCSGEGGSRVWGFTGYKNNITRIASHFYSCSFYFSLYLRFHIAEVCTYPVEMLLYMSLLIL